MKPLHWITRPLAWVALSLPITALSATYTLAPRSYVEFQGCPDATAEPGCAVYTTAMGAGGQFTVAAPLPSGQTTAVTPTAFTFSDGVHTYDENNAWLTFFNVSTDASGAVTSFFLEARTWLTGAPPHAVGDRLATLYMDQTLVSATNNVVCYFIPVGKAAQACTLSTDSWNRVHNAAATNTPGTFTTIPAVPGAPASTTAVGGDGAVRVGWTPPASDGGSPLTGYAASAWTLGDTRVGGCTAAADETGCVISGLDNGTPYVLEARAVNAQGEGPAQAAPGPVTPSWIAFPATAPGTTGTTSVTIRGGQPGCAITGTPQFSGTGIPPGAPANADFPVGAFSFNASGCKQDTLTVSITYPQPLADNVQLMKFGPRTALAPTSEWFPAPGADISHNRMTVTYTVADNGPGDSDFAEGAIADQFAPMALPLPPATPASIPTLSEWGLALLSLLAAAFGLRAARRRLV